MRFLYDPGLALAAAKALYEFYGSLQESRQRAEMLKLLKSISGKVREISRKQDLILEELKQLRIEIPTYLRDEFLKFLDSDRAAESWSLDVTIDMESVPDSAKLERLVPQAKELEKLSFKFTEYGAPAVSMAMGSAVLLTGVYDLMREHGANRRIVNETERSFIVTFDEAIARWFGSDVGGLEHARSAIVSERVSLETSVNASRRRLPASSVFVKMRYSPTRNADCEVHNLRELVITGDLQNGFSDHYEVVGRDSYIKCRRRPDDRRSGAGDHHKFVYDPENPFELGYEDEKDESVDEIGSGLYELGSSFAKSALGATSRPPVNHPATAALNKAREAWLANLDEEAQIDELIRVLRNYLEATRKRALQLTS